MARRAVERNRGRSLSRWGRLDRHEQFDADPSEVPNILLTNYLLLELDLTRPHEQRRLAKAAEGLPYLVLVRAWSHD